MEKDIVIENLKEIAKKYKVDKLVLFGSRARGDNSPVSDYDFAVFERDLTSLDKAYFLNEVDELETLKKVDIVFVRESATDELMKSIVKEGITIYEY